MPSVDVTERAPGSCESRPRGVRTSKKGRAPNGRQGDERDGGVDCACLTSDDPPTTRGRTRRSKPTATSKREFRAARPSPRVHAHVATAGTYESSRPRGSD